MPADWVQDGTSVGRMHALPHDGIWEAPIYLAANERIMLTETSSGFRVVTKPAGSDEAIWYRVNEQQRP